VRAHGVRCAQSIIEPTFFSKIFLLKVNASHTVNSWCISAMRKSSVRETTLIIYKIHNRDLEIKQRKTVIERKSWEAEDREAAEQSRDARDAIYNLLLRARYLDLALLRISLRILSGSRLISCAESNAL